MVDRYYVISDFKVVEIFGDSYLLAKKRVRKTMRVLTPMNEMARYIWDGVSEGKSLQQIAKSISEECDTDYAQVLNDVDVFCKTLSDQGYLRAE